MTAPLPETLHLEGRALSMPSTPLEGYLHKHSREIPADQHSYCTALRRGYLGNWSIMDGRFYLQGLENLSGKTIALQAIFPDMQAEPLLCDWFSGELHVWDGVRLPRLDILRQSVYDREIVLQVENGVVVEIRKFAWRLNPDYPESSRERFITIALPRE